MLEFGKANGSRRKHLVKGTSNSFVLHDVVHLLKVLCWINAMFPQPFVKLAVMHAHVYKSAHDAFRDLNSNVGTFTHACSDAVLGSLLC